MQAENQEVFERTLSWLKAGSKCWLSTVVATYGSSPRPPGSTMVCNTDGHIAGSLSGGCVEDDLLDKLTAGKLATSKSQFFRYGESEEEAEQLGLPCGGHLDIIVEPLLPDEPTIGIFARICDRLANRRLVKRRVSVTQGNIQLSETASFEPFKYDYDSGQLTQVHGPSQQLFVIGAGMVSRYVAEFAQALEFNVTVCDPRQAMVDEFDVPGVTCVCDMPDDVIRESANDSQTAIVALTHDPRIDDMGLLEAFETGAFYIGAMGSARTSENRRKRLKELNISDASLARLHAPIGIKIGSKTPSEIAISILAEIVQVRAALSHQDSTTNADAISLVAS